MSVWGCYLFSAPFRSNHTPEETHIGFIGRLRIFLVGWRHLCSGFFRSRDLRDGWKRESGCNFREWQRSLSQEDLKKVSNAFYFSVFLEGPLSWAYQRKMVVWGRWRNVVAMRVMGGRHAGLPMQGLRTPHDARCETLGLGNFSMWWKKRDVCVSCSYEVKHAGDSRWK